MKKTTPPNYTRPKYLNLFLYLVFLPMFLGSCVSQKATVKSKKNLDYGKVYVSPAWEYKETGGSKISPFIIGLASAGGAYFGNVEYDYDGKHYSKEVNAVVFGLGGTLLAAAIKKGIIALKTKRKRDYIRSDRKKWIRNYNRINNYDFVLYQENPNNSLVLYPKKVSIPKPPPPIITGTPSLPQLPSNPRPTPNPKPSASKPSIASGKGNLNNIDWAPVTFFDNSVFPSFVLGMANYSGSKEFGKYGDISSALGFSINNTGRVFKVKYEIKPVETDYFDPIVGEKELSHGENFFFPSIPWKFNPLVNLKQPQPLKVFFRVSDQYGNKAEKLETIRLKSINDCILSYGDIDFTFLFAAYVNEGHPEIDKILREGIDNAWVNQWTGYQQDSTEVIKQVYAIWRVLQKRGLVYSNIPDTEGCGNNLSCQHVRLFSEAIENRQANCVDGTVVFASILKKIGIYPMIVLYPGHSFLGFALLDGNGEVKIKFLETTMLGNETEESKMYQNFQDALSLGELQYLKYKNDITIIDIEKERKRVKPIGK